MDNIETIFGEPKPTYFVIREGGRAPRYRHASRHSAEREATRLTAKTPGATFHVVKLKKTLTNRPSRRYPDDGGLGEPKRPLGAGVTSFDILREAIFGEKKRLPRCGDLVIYVERGVERQGEVKNVVELEGCEPSYTIRDIIDNTIVPRNYPASDLKVTTKAEERPSAAKACGEKMPYGDDPVAAPPRDESPARVIPVGSKCWVINSVVGFATVLMAILTAYDPDEEFVWCQIEDNPRPQKVNASRVFAIDDKRFKVVSVEY